MSRVPSRRVSPSFGRLFVHAALAVVAAAGTAHAQSGSQVRVVDAETEVKEWMNGKGDVVMSPAPGTVFVVLDTEGDKFVHRASNWYLVVLPQDPWGMRRHGWVSGRVVEPVAAAGAPAKDAAVSVVNIGAAEPAPAPDPAPVARPTVPLPSPVPEAAEKRSPSEVVLHFDFGKSHLTDDAKSRLAGALKTAAQGVAFALEGHADATGTEAFNEKLGLARAETVRRYLAEQYQVPLQKISVVSYGENAPAASNTTREGRAQNRRVVVKVGA